MSECACVRAYVFWWLLFYGWCFILLLMLFACVCVWAGGGGGGGRWLWRDGAGFRRIKLSAPAVYTSVQGERRKFPVVHKKKSERE